MLFENKIKTKWGVDWWEKDLTGNLRHIRHLVGTKTEARNYDALVKVRKEEERKQTILGIKRVAPLSYEIMSSFRV